MDIIVKNKSKRIKKIGLALGGGGARGFALLGAIKAFEECNINFDFVAGTSVGALVGALYCYGKNSEEMIAYSKTLRTKDIKRGIIPFMPSKTEGLKEIITDFVGNIQFKDLKLPFCAVAVDVRSGKEIHISKGDLISAIAGSCAVPALFSPQKFGEYMLFDGGLQNTIPADVPKLYGCDAVVAVDINSTRGEGTDSDKYVDIIMAAISIMMKGNAIKGYLNADVMIQPNLRKFKSISFMGAEEMIDEGYKATMKMMPQIKELVRKRKSKWFMPVFK